jgi:hypothetical protein
MKCNPVVVSTVGTGTVALRPTRSGTCALSAYISGAAVNATASGGTFVKWQMDVGSRTEFSTDNPYSFVAQPIAGSALKATFA